MVTQSKFVEPTPEWVIRTALAAPMATGNSAIADLVNGGVTGEATSGPGKWDGWSFWRTVKLDAETVNLEFNANWRERFTNPQWEWHAIPRSLFANSVD